MSTVPKPLEAKLLVESKNMCNVCWNSQDVQIHHIIQVKDGGDDTEDNLIVICLNCHSRVHTNRRMSRNYSPETLRLYKTTWLDLIKKYPFGRLAIDQNNDIKTIEQILNHGDRRALYFPLQLEIPYSMFKSISEFRISIQKSGYRLLKSSNAKESIQQIYKTLIEIEYLFPSDTNHFQNCLPGMLGREGIDLLEIKRQTIIYHINNLARLIGYEDDYLSKSEFSKIGFNLISNQKKSLNCYGNFDKNCRQCENCDFKSDCITQSIN